MRMPPHRSKWWVVLLTRQKSGLPSLQQLRKKRKKRKWLRAAKCHRPSILFDFAALTTKPLADGGVDGCPAMAVEGLRVATAAQVPTLPVLRALLGDAAQPPRANPQRAGADFSRGSSRFGAASDSRGGEVRGVGVSSPSERQSGSVWFGERCGNDCPPRVELSPVGGEAHSEVAPSPGSWRPRLWEVLASSSRDATRGCREPVAVDGAWDEDMADREASARSRSCGAPMGASSSSGGGDAFAGRGTWQRAGGMGHEQEQ